MDHLLQRIAEDRRVLVIAAHPDDEDTGLLTLLARGYGARAAYLSLSRGDGGQNLIGDELGVRLGLLRSQELVAARSIDGAEQFFTRAFDFGYSRSLEETSRFWPPDSVQKDVVRIIRRFRPHVIVSVFTGTPRDRHGQHQMAGHVARPAFEAASDPTKFPELLTEEGLDPWTPLKLYRSSRFNPNAATVNMETGKIDPRVGRTFHQIAMASRSRHRSQDMGRLQRVGPASARVRLDVDRVGGNGAHEERDLFDGIPRDTSWIARLADSLRSELSASQMVDMVPSLARALSASATAGLSSERRALVKEAVAIAADVVVDARADAATVTPGQRFDVEVDVYNAGPLEIVANELSLVVPPGWTVDPSAQAKSALAPGDTLRQRFRVTVSPEAVPTQAYFLNRRLTGALYDWSETPAEIRGVPFDPPLIRAEVQFTIAGALVTVFKEVTHRYNDQAIGEIREEVRVVPLIDVKVAPDRVVWPTNGAPRQSFAVSLTYNGSAAIRGNLRLETSDQDWRMPASVPFRFTREGETRVVSFDVDRPERVEQGTVQFRAVATTSGDRRFDSGVELIRYSHIRSTPYVVDAVSDVHVARIELPRVDSVAYVRGAADRVPEALRQVGLPLRVLNAEDLLGTDLERFDAIVIGSRAYETDPALVRHNDRLLAYVQGGGLLLVQYQQYAFARGNFAPYTIDIGRPHDRVTDENSPVTVLVPEHRAFTAPNIIAEDDWDGWPQERGLYFGGTWDDAYAPLVEMADPGLEPVRGGILVAQYGSGTYVYTGLSFVRALPAGVPGAFRLFLNLIGLNQ